MRDPICGKNARRDFHAFDADALDGHSWSIPRATVSQGTSDRIPAVREAICSATLQAVGAFRHPTFGRSWLYQCMSGPRQSAFAALSRQSIRASVSNGFLSRVINP
jgi:hypothetical protein